MSHVIYPREHNSEDIDWKETDTTFFSTALQGTELWDRLHIGCISASKNSTFLDISEFTCDKEEAWRQCLGLSDKSFNSKNINKNSPSVKLESIIRDWYGEKIGKKIHNVGIAVWKKDTRFRASLDGMYKSDESLSEFDRGIEIKITNTGHIYRPLLDNFSDKKRKNNYDHIWTSHKNQLMQSMAVTGLKSIDYIVYGYKTGLVYIEEVKFDEKYWNDMIYTKGIKFLDEIIDVKMVEHGIKRIDPWMIQS